MPRTAAGRRYPHATTDARRHACIMCHIIGMIADRAAAGAEEWGTPHRMPPVTDGEDCAAQVRRDLFLGRSCRKLASRHGPLSVSVHWLTPGGETVNRPAVRRPEGWVLVVRVWSRDQGNAEIVRRASAGEQLHYNVLKGN